MQWFMDLRCTQGRNRTIVKSNVHTRRLPLQTAKIKHSAQRILRLRYQIGIGDIEDCTRYKLVPTRHQTPIVVVVLRQRIKLIAPCIRIAKHGAIVAETYIHGIAHHVQYPGPRQGSVQPSSHHPVNGLLVNEVAFSAGAPLCLCEISLSEFDPIQFSNAIRKHLIMEMSVIGRPAELLSETRKFSCRNDFRMVAKQAFENGGSRARQSDHEDRLRTVGDRLRRL
ncbi:MAG: hypothetical protein BGP23_01215 [Lysobacterales bacterium 66-474]|nr:MAG: hypothetical protein ABT18_02080 [Rhodanobacter sp. SCN 66-43]OJY82174.1 MAG: hypothetical protein BGP23_01215 [Xanthomonadales bacterium 66-474]